MCVINAFGKPGYYLGHCVPGMTKEHYYYTTNATVANQNGRGKRKQAQHRETRIIFAEAVKTYTIVHSIFVFLS